MDWGLVSKLAISVCYVVGGTGMALFWRRPFDMNRSPHWVTVPNGLFIAAMIGDLYRRHSVTSWSHAVFFGIFLAWCWMFWDSERIHRKWKQLKKDRR